MTKSCLASRQCRAEPWLSGVQQRGGGWVPCDSWSVWLQDSRFTMNCIRGWGKSASRFYRRLCLGLTAGGSLDLDRDVLGHGGLEEGEGSVLTTWERQRVHSIKRSGILTEGLGLR